MLPSDGPKITGGRPRYHINDIVNVNCTSGRSKPATHLTWFINGEPVDSSYLKNYDTLITGREGLETTILGLEFKVRANHFRKGAMKLKVRHCSIDKSRICLNEVLHSSGIHFVCTSMHIDSRLKHYFPLLYLFVKQCLAKIASVYSKSNEESVEGEKPQKAPALESRGTVYASNSRADRVQGKYLLQINT